MKIMKAVILVELEDGKVYQVDLSSTDVMYYLNIINKAYKHSLDVIDKPINGIDFTVI